MLSNADHSGIIFKTVRKILSREILIEIDDLVASVKMQ